MKARGKISLAHKQDTAVLSFGASVLATHRRPEPPEELTQEQAQVWQRIVKRLPPEWFPEETIDMLADYCRCVTTIRMLAKVINKLESAGLGTPKQLAAHRAVQRDHLVQTRTMLNLATRMRLTQQSTYDQSRKKGSTSTNRLWDV